MLALVTGAAGFIGSHLSESLLADGHDVVGIDSFTDYYARWIKERNLETARSHNAYRFVEGDLTELELDPLIDGADTVYHLAAQAGVRSSWGKSFEVYLRDNILATQRLLEASKGLSKFVYASSSSIYGDAENYPTPETALPKPVSPYGVSKLAGEHLCHLYWRRSGIPTVALRFFTVYGPRQRPDMAFHIFCRKLLSGSPIQIFGDGEQSREFTFVQDIVRALRQASERGAAGGVYNVGGGSETTLNATVRLLMDIAGKTAPLEHTERQPGDARRTVADSTRARRDLGYAPEIGLEEGLRAELAYVSELLEVEASHRGNET